MDVIKCMLMLHIHMILQKLTFLCQMLILHYIHDHKTQKDMLVTRG